MGRPSLLEVGSDEVMGAHRKIQQKRHETPNLVGDVADRQAPLPSASSPLSSPLKAQSPLRNAMP